MAFKRTIEDFKCENCGQEVSGNGYTNHCPICLFSKHVDIDPGDRENDCRGLMQPIGLETDKDGFDVVHKCLICGEVKKVKSGKSDNIDGFLTDML